MQVTIDVTQEDINEGKPGEAYCCALMLATQRKLHVKSSSGIWLTLWPNHRLYLPEHIAQWVIRYDTKADVGPVSFILEVPEEYVLEAAR